MMIYEDDVDVRSLPEEICILSHSQTQRKLISHVATHEQEGHDGPVKHT